MCELPDWLPDLINLTPWTPTSFDELYSVFHRDFVMSKPVYAGKPVHYFKKYPDDFHDGKEMIFWHLTSRTPKRHKVPRRMRNVVSQADEDLREPDFRRAERLPWVRAIIENHHANEVITWDHQEGDGRIKTYFWLEDFDFVVIMKKLSNGQRRIVTSFHVDNDWTRKGFQKKYDERLM